LAPPEGGAYFFVLQGMLGARSPAESFRKTIETNVVLSPSKSRERLGGDRKEEAIVALTTAQNTEISNRLDSLGREVRDQIRETVPHMANERFTDLAGSVYDSGDESVASMLEEFNHTLLERYVRELRRIDTARTRLAGGEIDECVECGGDIGYKRLHVHPVATRCIHCQTRHEKTYVGEARPKL